MESEALIQGVKSDPHNESQALTQGVTGTHPVSHRHSPKESQALNYGVVQDQISKSLELQKISTREGDT